MTTKFGFSALNNNLNQNLNNGFATLQAIIQAGLIQSVRVLSIVLDENHPRFIELGEWNGLGTIEYESVKNPLPSQNPEIAKPLYSNNKKYPLINEIVYLLSLPNSKLDDSSTSTSKYYLDVVSLWNHCHHNGYPTLPNELPSWQKKDYIQTQKGNVRRITDKSTEIDLGKTFIERSNIHPLKPFEGDIIYEGRWGNSIRFSSTIKTKTSGMASLNNWSTGNSISGDPIVILRNGQGKQSDEGWIPVVEDINNDESSIYLTSTQKIPLKSSSNNYSSYLSNPPINPGLYEGKQVIINSGRLVFNSTNDHILLSSNKSINLNSQNGLNIDTNTAIFQTKNIYLGSKLATEPLLLGNKTVALLETLIMNLKAFMQVASSQVGVAPTTALAALNIAANNMGLILNDLETDLESIKSKNNFTT
jgi:hypothetical protein